MRCTPWFYFDRNKLGLIVLLFFSSSCTFIISKYLGVSKPTLFESQVKAFEKNETALSRKGVPYAQVFVDSSRVDTTSGKLAKKFTLSSYLTPHIYNRDGNLLCFDTIQYPSCTNQPHQVLIKYNVPVDSLQVIDSIYLSQRLHAFRNVDWKEVQLKKDYDYYVFLNWSTYMKGPQEKNFNELHDKMGHKKVFYFFVNNDFYAKLDTVTW
ncbi:MAG: hypothetical protein C0424_07785 [Sphingobacteriaceae bacterium]|nr:hypothetical protein [Sphingobacteriaceae bacterium]